MASLQLDADELRPLVQAIVAETLAALGHQGDNRLAFFEPEAAAMVGMQPHQLRDLRLAGRIKASKGPRGRALYTKADLLAYLAGPKSKSR